jgi:hypothetical protein
MPSELGVWGCPPILLRRVLNQPTGVEPSHYSGFLNPPGKKSVILTRSVGIRVL